MKRKLFEMSLSNLALLLIVFTLPYLVLLLISKGVGLSDSTIYSSSFNEEEFKRIRKDDSLGQIKAALGAPLTIVGARWNKSDSSWLFRGRYPDSPYVVYFYSASDRSSHYRQRGLIVDTNSLKVVEKISRFYVD